MRARAFRRQRQTNCFLLVTSIESSRKEVPFSDKFHVITRANRFLSFRKMGVHAFHPASGLFVVSTRRI